MTSGSTPTTALADGPVVLILTHPDDVHAQAVCTHLDKGGVEVHRVDTATLGVDVPVTAHLRQGAVVGRLGDCDLARVTCVWHRRPSEIQAQSDVDAAELRAGVGGVLACLPHLNRPVDMVAALKPYQLLAAGRCGLCVPETVVTTDAAAGRALACGAPVVVKPMSRTAGGLVREDDLSGWSRAMHMTQQRIDKTHDVRVTVVDRHLYAVRIDSAHIDWRADVDACRYTDVAIPRRVADNIRRLMTTLRLRYGALDFAVDRHRRWWFLEFTDLGLACAARAVTWVSDASRDR